MTSVEASPLVQVTVDLTPSTMNATVDSDKGDVVTFDGVVTVDSIQSLQQTTTLTGSTSSGWNVSITTTVMRSNGPASFIFGVVVRVPKGVTGGLEETLTVRASCQMSVLTPSVDSDTSQITVKNTSPVPEWVVRISDPSPHDMFDSDSLTINGTASYNLGTVSRVEVKVCTGPWTIATGTSEWTIDYDCSYLEDGEHTIYARARSGDDVSPNTELKVKQQRTTPTADGGQNPSSNNVDDGMDYWLIALVIVIVLVVVGVVYYIHRRRQQADNQYYVAFA